MKNAAPVTRLCAPGGGWIIAVRRGHNPDGTGSAISFPPRGSDCASANSAQSTATASRQSGGMSRNIGWAGDKGEDPVMQLLFDDDIGRGFAVAGSTAMRRRGRERLVYKPGGLRGQSARCMDTNGHQYRSRPFLAVLAVTGSAAIEICCRGDSSDGGSHAQRVRNLENVDLDDLEREWSMTTDWWPAPLRISPRKIPERMTM
jgi:hypothetical protein